MFFLFCWLHLDFSLLDFPFVHFVAEFLTYGETETQNK